MVLIKYNYASNTNRHFGCFCTFNA